MSVWIVGEDVKCECEWGCECVNGHLGACISSVIMLIQCIEFFLLLFTHFSLLLVLLYLMSGAYCLGEEV